MMGHERRTPRHGRPRDDSRETPFDEHERGGFRRRPAAGGFEHGSARDRSVRGDGGCNQRRRTLHDPT